MDVLRAHLKQHAVALTGGVATGKSTVAVMLRDAGFLVVDADQLARDVSVPGSPGLQAIVTAFGSDILATSGGLDRAKLGALVFADGEKRRQLEAITHPLIRAALGELLRRHGAYVAPRTFFYEAALIFERDLAKDFRAVWVTYCSRAQQIARLMQRSGLDAVAAERIVAAQMPADEKAKRADVVIDTSGDLLAVKHAVTDAIARLASA